MQTTTLSFSNLHQHGELFTNLLRARRQGTVVQAPWGLRDNDDMEFDQYDTPQSRWVAIHERSDILAGVRLTPTTAKCGVYSYMIRDAQRGILGGTIPPDLLHDEAPVAAHIWEGSRIFVNQALPAAQQRKIHMALLEETARAARELGATQLIGIISTIWPRWVRRHGLDVAAIGRRLPFAGGVSQCVSVNLAQKLH